MSRFVCRPALVILALLLPVSVATAQNLTPARDRRPDLRVRFDRPSDALARAVLSATPASRRRGALGDRLQLNIHGGVGFHGTGGFLDDACDAIDDLYAIEGFSSTRCGGSGGGKPLSFGGFLSYGQPFGSVKLQFQGGYSYSGENEIRLESDATYGDFNAEVMLTGGYRFTSHSFYGGAGVEWNKLTVGGRIGMNRHSGDEFLTQRLTFDGQVYDEFKDERPSAGTTLLLGLRVMYAIVPGVRFYADWDCYDLGDLYGEFDEEDLPPSLQMPIRNRAFTIGVSFDVFSFYK